MEAQQSAPLMDEIPGLSCPDLRDRAPDDRPAGTAAAGTTGPAAAVPRGLRVRPARVLVVESQYDLASTLASRLRRAGYEVCTASDGLAALYGLRRHRPDVVVLNLDVPGVSGFRLLRVLKEDRVEGPVPVLVVTALSFDEAREAARAGADGFLELPCPPTEVVDRVRHLLARDVVPSTRPAPAARAGSPARPRPVARAATAVEVPAA
jgi:CheY-like chemotaxis protein